LLGQIREPAAMPVALFEKHMRDGAVVLDCRSPEAYAVHVPGALNVGLEGAFATWAGSVLPERAAVLLVVERPDDVVHVTWSLLRVGYEVPVGWLAGGMPAWRKAARPLGTMALWSVHDLRREAVGAPDLLVLDVRQPAEWRAGHIVNARHVTAAALSERAGELPRDKWIAVICSSGYRSGVAASVLKKLGFERVANVMGGMSAWRHAGYDVTRD
jgi:hydroxyacylglutathione hydrolase